MCHPLGFFEKMSGGPGDPGIQGPGTRGPGPREPGIRDPGPGDPGTQLPTPIWPPYSESARFSDFRVFSVSLTSIFDQTNGHHKQYHVIQVDIIYLTTCFVFDFQDNFFIAVWKVHLSGTGSAGARKVKFNNSYKYKFREVQSETRSEI